MNKVEQWKSEKHGFDIWPDVLRHAEAATPMNKIDDADLERMKWHGVFYRKRDAPGNYMLRIRLTGCELNAAQAREIAYIAYEYGHGFVDVTTRANIQVQGLSIDNVPKAIARLEATGLTAKQTGHDNIRNVFCHPLSGLDPDELVDTRPLCRRVSDVFLESRVYSDLPRKFNIAISGREPHGLHYWSQDISYLACRVPGGEIMFQMLIAGTQGQNPRLGVHLPVLVAPGQVVEVTRAILDLFREHGSREKRDRARFRYLVEEIGVGGVLEHLEKRLPFPLFPHTHEPQPPGGYDELVGWFRQRDPYRWAMGLCVPLGRMSWQQLEGLTLLSRRWGDGTLRATCEQGIIVANIATGFKDAAATAAAGQGLSVHADTLLRNTVACTGRQFCNIAVVETKGQMFQLIEKLRQRALTLYGIRIHMSGCPSSCAQHHTADIGLKGVRVRRLLGTREGFDVYLGGGVAGKVHLAMPYRLGVDVDQLPQLIEEVVREYYLKHKAGQTFSAYWREKLQASEALKVVDGDYSPPTWLCEGCGYRHLGEDPPVYCPSCAGLRRLFARLDEPAPKPAVAAKAASPERAASAERSDGFVFAAKAADLTEGEGLAFEVDGNEYALFRVGDAITAVDGICPHEGAPLVQGTVDSGVVTCPWHGWTFNACTGCSVEPVGHDLRSYETKVEDGNIFVKLTKSPAGVPQSPAARNGSATSPNRPRPATAMLRVAEILQETPDTKTFRFDNTAGLIPWHLPGQFVRLSAGIDGREHARSFTISSSPARPQFLDLTIKRNPEGVVSNYLHDHATVGMEMKIAGPQGAFCFDAERHAEPLVLVSAGSGITPMMSILRNLVDESIDRKVTFVHGARSAVDVIFADECARLARERAGFHYHVQLSQPPGHWSGATGRIDFASVAELVDDVTAGRYFLCGPGDFMDSLMVALVAAGVPRERIHTEEFAAAVPQISPA